MKLYSYKGSYPYPLPEDMDNYSIEHFFEAPEKPKITGGQKLGWQNNQWVIEEPSEAELAIKWQEIRNQRTQLLASSDILIMRLIENGNIIPLNIKQYRQNLRDITLQQDPWNIIWPIIEEQ